MSKLRRIGFLAAALCATSGVAFAQSPGSDWQGPYVGVHLGGAYADFENSVPSLPGPTGDASSGIGGFQLGYNFQNGDMVFGPEIDFTLMELEGKSAGGKFSEDSMASLRFRAGKVVGDYLIFGSLGVAWTETDIGFTGTASTSDYEPGVMVGGGAERFIREGLSGRIEAYYVDVPKSSQTVSGIPTSAGSQNLLFRAGLNLHF